MPRIMARAQVVRPAPERPGGHHMRMIGEVDARRDQRRSGQIRLGQAKRHHTGQQRLADPGEHVGEQHLLRQPRHRRGPVHPGDAAHHRGELIAFQRLAGDLGFTGRARRMSQHRCPHHQMMPVGGQTPPGHDRAPRAPGCAPGHAVALDSGVVLVDQLELQRLTRLASSPASAAPKSSWCACRPPARRSCGPASAPPHRVARSG